MKCLTPITIKNPAFRRDGKNNEFSTSYQAVRCRKCVNCLKYYLSSWLVRLELEADSSLCSYFVTLTYNDENRPSDVSKDDIRNFHRRIKYRLSELKSDMKYIVISEYTPIHGYPHYHGLYFNVPEYLFDDCWKYGFIKVDDVIPERINYVMSYHFLKDENVPYGKAPNFRFFSDGLGFDGFLDNQLSNAEKNDWLFVLNNELVKSPIHPYYRRKFGVKLPPVAPDPQVKSVQELKDYYVAIGVATDRFLNRKLKNKGF